MSNELKYQMMFEGIVLISLTITSVFIMTQSFNIEELILQSEDFVGEQPAYKIIEGPYRNQVETFIQQASAYGYLKIPEGPVEAWAVGFLGNGTHKMELFKVGDKCYLVTVKYNIIYRYTPPLGITLMSIVVLAFGWFFFLVQLTTKPAKLSPKK